MPLPLVSIPTRATLTLLVSPDELVPSLPFVLCAYLRFYLSRCVVNFRPCSCTLVTRVASPRRWYDETSKLGRNMQLVARFAVLRESKSGWESQFKSGTIENESQSTVQDGVRSDGKLERKTRWSPRVILTQFPYFDHHGPTMTPGERLHTARHCSLMTERGRGRNDSARNHLQNKGNTRFARESASRRETDATSPYDHWLMWRLRIIAQTDS